MSRRSRDQSIENEPYFGGNAGASDPSEERAERVLRAESARDSRNAAPDHTVWDEPTLSTELAGEAAPEQVTYARWIERNLAETSLAASWFTTLLVALAAGPWGVLGALFGGVEGGTAGFAAYTIIGPVTEEIMKIAAALWVIERKPYLFKSMLQIFLCAAAGGAAFGVIENLMYLNVYVPSPSADFAHWRWTVCTSLHVNCSFIAGVGLVRIWDNAIRNRHRPQLALGVPWFVLAMAGHGMYNGLVIVAERAGWLTF
ncbi:MAG: PrsW family glutamic-type intramembrane protease [Pirellulales bacterium]